MLHRRLASLSGAAVTLLAGGAWYFAADRVAHRLGAHEAAPAVGILTGAVIALALWRRNAADRLEQSLARLVCPVCGARLVTTHEHAGDTHPDGLREWSCAACSFAHALPLTCEECAR